MERRAWRRWIAVVVMVVMLAASVTACKASAARVFVVRAASTTAKVGLLDVLMPPLLILWVMEWLDRDDPPDPNRTVYKPLVLP